MQIYQNHRSIARALPQLITVHEIANGLHARYAI